MSYILYKASGNIDSKVVFIVVKYGETHTNLLYNAYIYYKKRVIRTITHNEYLANTSKLFTELGILKLPDIIKYEWFLLAFKAFHNMLLLF